MVHSSLFPFQILQYMLTWQFVESIACSSNRLHKIELDLVPTITIIVEGINYDVSLHRDKEQLPLATLQQMLH